MQGKGLIRFVAIAITIGCLYSLSFTWMANKVEKSARAYAKGDPLKEKAYLDSMGAQPIFDFLPVTYNSAKDKEIPLGLDLKGGMNVTMEISLSELVRNLANKTSDQSFCEFL